MRKVVTLLFLVKNDEILLAMKKRGFGKGKWNGAGGKVEPNETIEQAMLRETAEEICVTPTEYVKVAVNTFLMPGADDIECHTYVARSWEGEPTETEEMAPKWFKQTNIPYENMWQDDTFWLPAVLSGKKLKTRFIFDEHDNMLTANLTLVDSLE